jgi:fructokinase
MTGSDPDVLVAGETLIDFLPDSTGSLADVETFSRRAGGAPANVAVALAQLGDPPWFWTRVGEDPFGDFLVETLREYGVPDRFVERDRGVKTALAFVSHDEGGERSFTFYRDATADTRVQPGGVPDEALDGVDWVYVGGVMLAAEPGRSATLDLARRAAGRDCIVVFDPNGRPELWESDTGTERDDTDGSDPDGDDDFADLVAEMLDYAHVVKATPEDLAAAGLEVETEAGDEAEAERRESLAAAVCERGPHTVLLTLGGAGAFAYATEAAPWGADAAFHEGYDVDPVDTTGAGDAFTAGAIAALADGSPAGDESSLSEVLAFANAVAAVTTTAPGAMTTLPTREAVSNLRR